jgi:urease accessory protein UreH
MKEQLKQLDTKNMTSRQIALELRKNVSTVRSYLDKYHIPYKKKFSRQPRIETGASSKLFSWEIFMNDIIFFG